MVTNRKSSGRAMTLPGGVLMGACAAMLWTIGGAALTALLIDREVLAQTAIGYGSMVILLTASILGSSLAWQKVKHQRAVVCLCAGAAYFLMLLAATALFFGGQYHAVGITAALILAGSGSVVLMGLGKGNRPARKMRKIRR